MRNWAEHFGLVDKRSRSGEEVWGREHRYVFLTAEVAMAIDRYAALPPWEQATARAAAVAMTVDAAAVVGAGAARLWGIDVLGWEQPHVEVMLLDGRQPCSRRSWPRGVRYRYGRLPAGHVFVEHGLRVVGAGRALRDIAVYDGVERAVASIDAARRKWPELAVDRMRASMLGGPRFNGAAVVREALELSIPNSGSVRESQARVLLGGVAGIVSVVAQAVFVDRATGERNYVGFLINGWLVLEVDGDVKYDGVTYGRTDDAVREERRREKELQNQGKVVVRVTDPRDAPGVVAEALVRFAGVAV